MKIVKPTIKSEKIRKIFSDVSEEEVVDLTQVEPEESDFSQADDSLTQEEVESALSTIAGIADAVLEAEGKETKDLEYQDVLDIVDSVLEEPGEPDPEEINAIESSVINLTMAADGEPEELCICTGSTEDEITTVVGADDPAELITPAPIDAEADSELAIASNRNVDLSQAKTFKVAINSHWKDQDAVHAKAWEMAEEKTKAAGKTPDMGSKYYGMVMALAKTYYNRLTRGEVWEDAAELGSAKLKRVMSALRKVFSSEGGETYYFGELKDGGVMVYTHDEYVEKFGEEPSEDQKLEGTFSSKAAALKKIQSSTDIEGANPPKSDSTPGTDGDASGIDDEGLLADDSSKKPNFNDDVTGGSGKKQETDALGESVNFEAPATEELVLPDQSGSKAALEFQKVTNSVSVLSEKFRDQDWSHLYGKVRVVENNKGIVFLKSNLFGLVAVRGSFLKGIKNSRYTAYVRTNEGYVDASGNTYKSTVVSSKTQFLVASRSSNHSSVVSSPIDVVGLIESSYVKHLKSAVHSSSSSESDYHKKVSSRRAAFARKVLAQNLSLQKVISTMNTTIKSNSSTVSQLKRAMAEQEYLQSLKQRDQAIQSSKKDFSKQNVDYLASLI